MLKKISAGLRTSLLTVAALVAFVAIALAGTHVPPMPSVSGPLPVTAASKPLLYYKLLQRPLPLDDYNFVEEEFLISGRANLYDWPTAANQDLQIIYRDAPYTTRVLMRRPADLSKFSGNVYVEVMNPARGYDSSIVFSYMVDRILENGDAWVGISTGQVMAGLKRYDPVRYAPVNMLNPAPLAQWACPPAPTPAAGQAGGGGGGGQVAAPPSPRPQPLENGLRFDMFSQVARWVKSEDASNPLAPGQVDFVYMVSHTGGDVGTYVASVAREARQPNGGPIYDGYIIKTGSGVGALRNCGAGPSEGVFPGYHGRLPGAPIIQLKMQSDVPNQRRPDSDDPNDTFRMYEVAGTTHSDRWPYRLFPVNEEMRKMIDFETDLDRGVVTENYPYGYSCNVEGAIQNDFPLPYIVRGIMANLDALKRKGTPMPRTQPIKTVGESYNRAPDVVDEHGNPIGGLRSVWVDVPTKTWYVHIPGAFGTCYDMGYSVDWPLTKIQAVYGSIPNYVRLANASIDKMVAERIVTRADGEKIRAELLPPAATATIVPLSGDRIPTNRGDLVIRPITHASFVMQWNGKTIYVDPTGGGDLYRSIPRADLVLLTDIHGDHMHAPTLAQVTAGAPAVAPAAVRDALPANLRGMVTTILANGQTTAVDGIQIEAVPMYNVTPGRTDLHVKGRGNGYILTFGDKRVYLAGDTEPTPEMMALRNIDVAFLPMNQPFTMTPQQAAEAVKVFRPKIVYPYHYRGTDVNEFQRLVAGDAGIEVRLRRWY
jgi:L-ascorbate metabolism protein UlaG (beta-lactamase superfamily)